MNFILKYLFFLTFLWTTYPAEVLAGSILDKYSFEVSKLSYTGKNSANSLINLWSINNIDNKWTIKSENQYKLVLVCKDLSITAIPSSVYYNPECKGNVELEASAWNEQDCSKGNLINWQMFFDESSDGTVDRLATSKIRKEWQNKWVKIEKYVDGNINPEWEDLQNQYSTVVLKELIYVTYIQPTLSISPEASDKTVKLPVFSLSPGSIRHNVVWTITDDCGNEEQCQSKVDVIDNISPLPDCSDITDAILDAASGKGVILARVSAEKSIDNCTNNDKLYFTFDEIYPVSNMLHYEHYFKAKSGQSEGVVATEEEYINGKAQKWIPELRSSSVIITDNNQKDIKINVWDEAWNTDYCTAELKVTDILDGVDIIGNISTEANKDVKNVTVVAKMHSPKPPIDRLTNDKGNYKFLFGFEEAEISASKEGDDNNGVSTLDLVMIQRHILGLEAIKSPYKIIAADATHDGRVSASDITEIRKLVLGIITKFRNNRSWRFVVKDSYMDKENPFPFIEKYMASVVKGSESGFVAVKIGDVNNTAQTDQFVDDVIIRSYDKVILSVEDIRMVAGEFVSIPVRAKNYNNVSGFQFTMNLKGASFMGIQSGAVVMNEDNIGNLENGFVTMSYAGIEGVTLDEGEILFTILIRADKSTQIQDVLSLGSDVTIAESYNGDLETGTISLEIRSAEKAGIILYPNEPNPFKNNTTVRFAMPEAEAVTLRVYDLTGKLLTARNISAVKGLNHEVFTKEQLGMSGVMFFTLESAGYTSTRKMISFD